MLYKCFVFNLLEAAFVNSNMQLTSFVLGSVLGKLIAFPLCRDKSVESDGIYSREGMSNESDAS